MDDAQCVSLRECIGDLSHQVGRAHRWHRPMVAQCILQTATVNVFEDQIKIARLFTGVMDGHDVRMVQLADRARLIQQNGIHLRIRLGKVQRLDRHFALQLRIPGEIDDALATSSQFAADLETADGVSHEPDDTPTGRHCPDPESRVSPSTSIARQR